MRLGQRRNFAVHGLACEVSDGQQFGIREAGITEFLVRDAQNLLGRQPLRDREQRADSRKNRCGSPAVELLVDDRFGERHENAPRLS